MVFSVDIAIYGTSVLFLAGSTVEEFEEVYEMNRDSFTQEEHDGIVRSMEDKRCFGFTCWLDSWKYVVFIREPYKVRQSSHEIFHVANKILYSRDVTFDADAEAWAYLIGYITEKFYDNINGHEEDI